MGLILDTNFVITAERDARRGVRGKAHAFLAAHPSEAFYLTFALSRPFAKIFCRNPNYDLYGCLCLQ